MGSILGLILISCFIYFLFTTNFIEPTGKGENYEG